VPAPGWLREPSDPERRDLLAQRFGLGGIRPRTVVEIAEHAGVSERAVWSRLARAIRDARGERAV
ncbi:MAG: sigma factor-like helix-turn-helix DNA-binding protein, partial [Planctomycetota bacterium]